jgi:HSP20 family protein
MLSFPEVNELSEEVRRVFEELDRLRGIGHRSVSSLYSPALDVLETGDTIEVLVDLPGVTAASIRVFFKHGNLVIAGEKLATEPVGPEGSSFHLVERGFGRFARVVRLNTAVDARRARAVLSAGVLRITVPRIDERRGREIAVPIEEPGKERPR